jgi:hypothetical protein
MNLPILKQIRARYAIWNLKIFFLEFECCCWDENKWKIIGLSVFRGLKRVPVEEVGRDGNKWKLYKTN